MTSRIVLGTAEIGAEGGRESAFALLDAFVELGGDTLDTANCYSDWIPGETGRSEKIIGEWMAARGNRHAVTVATKCAHPVVGGDGARRLDPDSIRADVEVSLKRLRIDRIDMLFLHRDDVRRPAAEIVGTLQRLRDEGKVLAFGCSNWTAPRIAEALAVSGGSFVANQVIANALVMLMSPPGDTTLTTLDPPMFRQAVRNGLGLWLCTVQAEGLFFKRRKGLAPPRDYDNPACAAAVLALEAIAARERLDPNDLIVAFLLGLSPKAVALIGPGTPEQLHESFRANDLILRHDLVREVAAATSMSAFLD